MPTNIIDQLTPTLTKDEAAALGGPDAGPAEEAVEAAPPETKAVEPEAITTVEEKPAPPPEEKKYVPLPALQEAREETKRAREEARAARERAEQIAAAFEEVKKRIAPTPAEKIPTLEEDPVGFLKHQERELARIKETQAKSVQEREQQAAHAERVSSFQRAVAGAEATFRKEQADYDEAVDFAKNARRSDLLEVGMSPEEADRVLVGEVLFIAETALRNGRSPAQAMYTLAKRWGYKGTSSKPEDAKAANLEKATAKVAQIDAGKKASSAMAAADGDAPSGEMTVERLVNLKGAAFDKAFDQLFGAGRKGADIFGT